MTAQGLKHQPRQIGTPRRTDTSRHSREGGNPEIIGNSVTDYLDIWSSVYVKKATTGRGRNSKISPYGIQKLRELILELAVRGKLVPQEPNDEPASVLLVKIAKEKARLAKEGKIKKLKTLPNLSDGGKSFQSPNGWEWVRLGDISADIHYGYTASANPQIDEVRLLRITDIQDNSVEWVTVPGCEIDSEKIDAYRLEDGDILIARTGGTIGKSYLVRNLDVISVFASYLIRVRHLTEMLPAFVKVFLGSQLYWNQLYASSMGTGQPNVNGNALKNLAFVLPPLAEQHRIVAKVDELMALCAQLEQQQTDSIAAHQTLVETLLGALTTASDQKGFEQTWQRIAEHFDTLFTTKHSIDQLKRTILQLAVMGKLVPQDPSNEPASVLLEKIDKEKMRLVKEGKLKKQKTLPEIDDAEKPFDLLVGWEWARLDDLVLHSEAGWSPKCKAIPRDGDEWGVLKVSAVSWGKYDPAENKALPEMLEPRSEYEVKSRDFLISRANTADLVARAVVVPKDTPPRLMMSDKIIRFAISPRISSQYLCLVNNSRFSRDYYARVAGGTSSSMKNVSREQIRKLIVALPPLAEQHRIVAKVDELMALCDALKAHIQDAQTTQTHLADASVEQAVA